MQIRKGQRGKERIGRGRKGGGKGGSWHQTQSHRYGDGAVHSAPSILSYCRERNDKGKEKKRGGGGCDGPEDTDF